ncbi:MAG: HD domain-containing protein [Desulfobulbaceae bacterium]
MEKKVFVTDLADGEQVADLFLVGRRQLAETRNNKPYLALTLMDRSGEIEARVWDNALQFEPVAEPGRILAVEGQVKSFRDKLQLNVTSLRPVSDAGELLHLFVPASARDVDEMRAELTGIIDSVADPFLRQLLGAVFRGGILDAFCRAPAAKQMHHAFLGGLLEHTLSVTGLAARVADHYPSLDRDLLITGALLHDLGKIREFSFESVPFDYTDQGRLVGHLVIGAEIVRQRAAQIPDFPPELLDRVTHLILSHHGRHEFGAPCLPMTIEALLLHHIDDMDAKVNFIDRLSEQVEPGGYQWSDYQRTLERFLLLRGTGPVEEDGNPGRESSGYPTADEHEPDEQRPGSDRPDDAEKRQRKLF